MPSISDDDISEALLQIDKRIKDRNKRENNKPSRFPINIIGPRGQRLSLTIQESHRLREQLLEQELKNIV